MFKEYHNNLIKIYVLLSKMRLLYIRDDVMSPNV